MKLIDGKVIAEQIKNEIAAEVRKMIDDGINPPHLVAVVVGDDPASQTYVANKEKSCKEVGFTSSVYRLPSRTTEKELLETVNFLNNDNDVDGFIIQLPLPEHISVNKVIESINPAKDVDGFHPVNLGRMIAGVPSFLPATPYGIMQLIERSNIDTVGKHCVVLGRSNIVGTPISVLMSRNNAHANSTVTLCHSKTPNLKEICLQADILIVAIGKQTFVTSSMVKEGAVVIDVGMHRVPSTQTKSGFRLVGDVDFNNVSEKCSYITPVPGGVGLMTIVSLLMNTMKAAKKEFTF
ncbi:MAG: tetrahydrofolate dehydrogenase/cyclohydrolase catalytic domain-containing protein [Bacteroidota bacterium]